MDDDARCTRQFIVRFESGFKTVTVENVNLEEINRLRESLELGGRLRMQGIEDKWDWRCCQVQTGQTHKRAYLTCKKHGDEATILAFISQPGGVHDTFICEHCMVELMSTTFPTLLLDVKEKEKKDDVPVLAPDSP